MEYVINLIVMIIAISLMVLYMQHVLNFDLNTVGPIKATGFWILCFIYGATAWFPFISEAWQK